MDGGQRAGQPRGGAQFLQSQVGFSFQQRLHLAVMGRHNQRLAPGVLVARPDLTRVPALLQELFHHAQRHPVTHRDLFPCALLVIVGGQDSFAQIQGERFHARIFPQFAPDGYSFI